MGNLSAKKEKVPTVEVTCCTVHEYVSSRIKEYGNKVAQVDAVTGEKVTFDVILERASALAAGLSARGLRPGEVAIVIGENNINFPWVLLGVLQTGASAHLIDPRSTPREVEHALSISGPTVALVSAAVSQQKGVTSVLREFSGVRNVLVWGTGGANVHGDVGADLPDGIASLEQLIISPAKSASSTCSSPSASDSRTPTGPHSAGTSANGTSGRSEAAEASEVPVLSVKDVAPGLASTPSAHPCAPPPTPTSLGATYGDSCSPSMATSPLQKFLVHAVDGVAQPQGGSSVALILPSSGSTGLPKGVMITHDNLLAALELGPLFIDAQDVVAGLSPFFHAYGGLLMLMSLCAGTPMVTLARFSMEALLKAVEENQITVMHVVSSLLVSLGKLPAENLGRMKSLRRIWSGAAQISPLVQSALQSRLPGVKLCHSYGMTETTFTTFCGEVRADKPGSPGTLVKSMECKVIDPENGKPQPLGARGELCFRGPMVMRGYLGNAEATSEALDAEGWLRSGDLGFVDEDGYFYIVERIKDVLKYNGHQVSPSELEALLMTHPAVSEAAVIGEPHEYGEAPRALVVLSPGQHVTEEELQTFIAGKVAPHKQLRGGITFVASPFPRTASGKLQRKKLRALLHPDPDDSIASSTSNDAPSLASPASPTGPQVEPVVSVEAAPVLAPVMPDSSTAPLPPQEPRELQQEERQAGDDETAVFSSEVEAQPHVHPRPQAQQHRPSVVSVTSLSTIYSESPLTSPGMVSESDASFLTPASVMLREASAVPLPPSEPTSPGDVSAWNCTLGSGPMDLVSPQELASSINENNSPALSSPALS